MLGSGLRAFGTCQAIDVMACGCGGHLPMPSVSLGCSCAGLLTASVLCLMLCLWFDGAHSQVSMAGGFAVVCTSRPRLMRKNW